MKRKTLAILLSVLLVVSAVLVLTACQTKEYTVTFRNYNNSKLGEPVKTEKGKATFTRNDLLTADDRVFEGWYDSLNIGADGTMTYGTKVDLATATFTKDTTLYAKWTLIGESVGYCIPGVINGVTDWNLVTVVENAARKLTHQEGTNVYTMTNLTLKQGDSFKVVSAVPAETGNWAGNVKIEAGYSQLTVNVATDATLPEDYSGDTEDLISNGDMNNIAILYDMVIDLRFEYAATSEDCVVTITVKEASGEALADISELGYMLAGDFSSWNGPFTADGQYKDYILTPDAEKVVYTLNNVSIPGGGFKIKVNETQWGRDDYGYAQLMNVTEGDELVLPEGVTINNVFKDSGGNIATDYILTANITLDTENRIISIEVLSLELDDLSGYIVTGPFTGDPWMGSISATDETYSKYILTQDETNENKYEVTLPITKGQAFVVKENAKNWDVQYGMSAAAFVNGTGEDLPEGMTFENIFTGSGNITVNANATLKLTLNTAATGEEKALTVTILTIEATVITPDNELGIILTGNISGDPDNSITGFPATSEAYKLTANNDNTVFTIENVQLAQGNIFKLKVLKDGWEPSWGYHGENMTVDASAVDGEGSDYIADDYGNIKALADITVSIVFNYDVTTPTNSTYTITITAVAAAA